MAMLKKVRNRVSALSLALAASLFASPQFASANVSGLSKNIYSKTSDNVLAAKIEQVVKIVGGVGGAAFTLAILIIALVIIFGSVSSSKVGTVWKALISCIAGAFIFFSAYMLAPAIANLAG